MPFHYPYNDNQFLFDRSLSAIGIAVKWFFKAIIYLPLWFTGYMITFKLLNRDDNVLLWAGLIVIFAFALFQLLYFLKGLIIAFRKAGNLAWVPLFIVCTAFTTFIPAWACYDIFHSLASRLTNESASIVTWILTIVFARYIYSRYQFLTDTAPRLAHRAYKAGVSAGLSFH